MLYHRPTAARTELLTSPECRLGDKALPFFIAYREWAFIGIWAHLSHCHAYQIYATRGDSIIRSLS
jgi:hypothetical protein